MWYNVKYNVKHNIGHLGDACWKFPLWDGIKTNQISLCIGHTEQTKSSGSKGNASWCQENRPSLPVGNYIVNWMILEIDPEGGKKKTIRYSSEVSTFSLYCDIPHLSGLPLLGQSPASSSKFHIQFIFLNQRKKSIFVSPLSYQVYWFLNKHLSFL